MSERDDALIAALLTEREGYVRRGLADRVAAVDAAIRAAGGEPPSDSAAAKRQQAKRGG